MEIGTVSNLSIAGMVVSTLVAVLVPVILCIMVMRKTKAKFSSMLWGAGTFVLFALILEQLFHAIVLTATGTAITDNIWLYALYGGAAAAIFEETGRFVTMKFAMKKNLNKENALMYGVGHGGIEAILLVGISQISNIATSFMINAKQLDSIVGVLGEEQKATVLESLSALWTTPWHHFFLSGIERMIAMALHLCLSILVYCGIRQGKKRFVAAAAGTHFLVDFITVVVANKFSVWVVELLLFLLVAILGIMVIKLYKKETAQS